ncbi:class I SAM-dependent methyltransferase [Bacillus sp. 1P06AnD]|uniref:class I SAM-dependent methyltransferase n=1 Tax=Bacillus sp. 1P06AnD TaxID=3132208 RepID=UPI0039A2561C
MPIDFHNEELSAAYSNRTPDQSWPEMINGLTAGVSGKIVADIGCGGGIYTRILAELDADEVFGIDFSPTILGKAIKDSTEYKRISYRLGNAVHTGLASSSCDIVLLRAVIHHLPELVNSFIEANRILKPQGILLIQDRTPDDCFLEGSPNHIRGYFFSAYPQLKKIELIKRYTDQEVNTSMEKAGFTVQPSREFWENRAVFTTIEELEEDIISRKGRSILHELTDVDLCSLVAYMKEKVNGKTPIVDRNRWSVWKGIKN